MANEHSNLSEELFSAEQELEVLETGYKSLLQKYSENGDIDIFVDLQNRLLELKDKILELPPGDARFELLCSVTMLSNAINSLLH